MRVVIVPVVSGVDFDIVFRYAYREKPAYDELHLWMNTMDAPQIRRCYALEAAHDWVRVVRPTRSVTGGRSSLRQFARTCVDPGVTYLALSPDLVWMSEGFVRRMFDAMNAASSDTFLLFDDCINLAESDAFHSRFLAGLSSEGRSTSSTSIAEDTREELDSDTCAAVWRGADFARFGVRATTWNAIDAAKDLCGRIPALLGKKNRVCASGGQEDGWVACGGALSRLALTDAGILAAYAGVSPQPPDDPAL